MYMVFFLFFLSRFVFCWCCSSSQQTHNCNTIQYMYICIACTISNAFIKNESSIYFFPFCPSRFRFGWLISNEIEIREKNHRFIVAVRCHCIRCHNKPNWIGLVFLPFVSSTRFFLLLLAVELLLFFACYEGNRIEKASAMLRFN